jgi:hypothetical protein
MLNPNDAIAECNLNLKGLFSRVYKAKSGFDLDKQWLKMTHPNFEGTQGKIQCTLQLLTESESKSKPCMSPLVYSSSSVLISHADWVFFCSMMMDCLMCNLRSWYRKR